MSGDNVMLTRKMLLMAKVESTYGADADPTNGLKPILADAPVDFSPQGDSIKRNVVRPAFTSPGSKLGATTVPMKITCEMRGGGIVAGQPVAPDFEPLLLACSVRKTSVLRVTFADPQPVGLVVGEQLTDGGTGHGIVRNIEGDVVVLDSVAGEIAVGDVLTGGTSAGHGTVATATPGIEYMPWTAPIKDQVSALLHYHSDAILHTVPGFLAGFSLDCPAGGIARITFNGTGLWRTPADQAIPSPVVTDMEPPIFERASLRLGTYAPVISSLKLDQGNKITPRQDANSAEGVRGMFISSRDSSGSFDPEVTDLAEHNPWIDWKGGTKGRLLGTIGTEPGNRWRLDILGAQYSSVKYGDRSGLRTYDVGFVPTGGTDDEWRITLF